MLHPVSHAFHQPYTRQHICYSAICLANSVCLSRVYCIKTAERIIKILSLPDRPIILVFSRPVEIHSGARENIVGPYHPSPHSVCLEIEGVEREETWGEVSPHHPTRGSGERRKLP